MLAQGALAVFLLAYSAQVCGHGFVEKVIYNGEETLLYNPWEDQYNDFPTRPDRRFDDNGPMRDVDSNAIRCNIYEGGANNDMPAESVISVQAGEDITLRWTPKWIKNHFGPVITYLAHCADDDCTTFEAGRDAVWFKIDEAGYDIAGYNENGGSAEAQQSDCWASTTMEGRTDYTLRIPESLRSGQYLMRHEIIALHAAEDAWDGTNKDDSPGAQHYMQCIQFNVQSSGDAFPSEEEMVSFPGAYEADDLDWSSTSGGLFHWRSIL